jgi:hypothetical protein
MSAMTDTNFDSASYGSRIQCVALPSTRRDICCRHITPGSHPPTASLRDALYRGGIAPETLEVRKPLQLQQDKRSLTQCKILINGSDGLDQAGHGGYGHTGETSHGQASAAFPFSSQPPLVPTLSKDKSTYGQEWQQDSGHPGKLRPPPYSRNCSYEHDDASFPSDEKEDMTYGFTPAPRTEKQYQSKEERRTLVFKGLLDRTTHKDIIDVLSGGALLDIFLRSRERMASVSFVEGAAAQDFLYYAKRNDIYIHGKRVRKTSVPLRHVSDAVADRSCLERPSIHSPSSRCPKDSAGCYSKHHSPQCHSSRDCRQPPRGSGPHSQPSRRQHEIRAWKRLHLA